MTGEYPYSPADNLAEVFAEGVYDLLSDDAVPSQQMPIAYERPSEEYQQVAVNLHPAAAALERYEAFSEYQLGQLYQQGDGMALTALYMRHRTRIAGHAARLYDQDSGILEPEDVEQEVALLMIESVTHWTPLANNRVQASHYETEHAANLAERKGFSASLDKVHARYVAELAKHNAERRAQGLAPLTKQEIAEHFTLPPEPNPGRPNQHNAQHLMQAWQLTRGSVLYDEIRPSMTNQGYDPFEEVGQNAALANTVSAVIDTLPEYQKIIITSYYGLNGYQQSLQELSNQLGRSKNYVRQALHHVLSTLGNTQAFRELRDDYL